MKKPEIHAKTVSVKVKKNKHLKFSFIKIIFIFVSPIVEVFQFSRTFFVNDMGLGNGCFWFYFKLLNL